MEILFMLAGDLDAVHHEDCDCCRKDVGGTGVGCIEDSITKFVTQDVEFFPPGEFMSFFLAISMARLVLCHRFGWECAACLAVLKEAFRFSSGAERGIGVFECVELVGLNDKAFVVGTGFEGELITWKGKDGMKFG